MLVRSFELVLGTPKSSLKFKQVDVGLMCKCRLLRYSFGETYAINYKRESDICLNILMKKKCSNCVCGVT